MTAAGERRVRWGAPADEDDARSRLLDAAKHCYRSFGVDKTRMGHIAEAAGVHRTTVYSYFPTRDAVLAASFVREADTILSRTQALLEGGPPAFEERLVAATLAALEDARLSPVMGVLLRSGGRTLHAAAASEAWHDRAGEALEPALRAAVARGEVRDDLPVPMLLRLVWRIAFSLVAEPASADDGGDEGILRALVLPALRPPEAAHRMDEPS